MTTKNSVIDAETFNFKHNHSSEVRERQCVNMPAVSLPSHYIINVKNDADGNAYGVIEPVRRKRKRSTSAVVFEWLFNLAFVGMLVYITYLTTAISFIRG